MRYLRFAAAVALPVLALPTCAFARTTEDTQSWTNLSVFGSFSKKTLYFVEVQPRIGEDVSRLQTLLLRGAVGIQVSPSISLWQGYGHIVSPIEGGKDRNEERSFQQLWWTIRPGFWVRSRLEERWLSNGRDVGFRARSMIRYGHFISPEKKGVALLAFVEPFFNLNDTDWGARAGFDQVRSFAGFEIPTIGRSTVEIGYMNQRINDPGGRIRSNNIAAVNIFFRL